MHIPHRKLTDVCAHNIRRQNCERGIRKAGQREGRSHFSTCKGSWRAIWEKQANSPYGTQKRHGDRKISPGVRRVNLNVYTRSSSSPPILRLHPGPKQCVDFSSPSLQKRAEVEFFQRERIEGVCMLYSEIPTPFHCSDPEHQYPQQICWRGDRRVLPRRNHW